MADEVESAEVRGPYFDIPFLKDYAMKLPDLEKLAHSLVAHAKLFVETLHPKEEVAKILPKLADAIKAKADELLIKAGASK
jgi:hypothetical protein